MVVVSLQTSSNPFELQVLTGPGPRRAAVFFRAAASGRLRGGQPSGRPQTASGRTDERTDGTEGAPWWQNLTASRL